MAKELLDTLRGIVGERHVLTGSAIVAGVFAMTNLPSITIWATLGTQVKRLLTRPRLLRAFNWTMAGLLVLTLVPVWLG